MIVTIFRTKKIAVAVGCTPTFPSQPSLGVMYCTQYRAHNIFITPNFCYKAKQAIDNVTFLHKCRKKLSSVLLPSVTSAGKQHEPISIPNFLQHCSLHGTHSLIGRLRKHTHSFWLRLACMSSYTVTQSPIF